MTFPHGRTLVRVLALTPVPIDCGNASSTAGTDYDGGDAFSTMVDGLDGNYLGTFSGSGLTVVTPLTKGLTKSVIVHRGSTQAAIGLSGRTGVTSL